MLKAVADHTFILGLSERNIQLLKQGKPISINLMEMDLEDLNGLKQVVIMYGKTEQDIFNEIEKEIPYKPKSKTPNH